MDNISIRIMDLQFCFQCCIVLALSWLHSIIFQTRFLKKPPSSVFASCNKTVHMQLYINKFSMMALCMYLDRKNYIVGVISWCFLNGDYEKNLHRPANRSTCRIYMQLPGRNQALQYFTYIV